MTTRIGHTLTLKKKRGVLVSHGHCAYGHGPWLLQRGTLVSLALDRGTGSSSEHQFFFEVSHVQRYS